MKSFARIAVLAFVVGLPRTAGAHEAAPPDGPWWLAWSFDQPLVLTNLGLLTAVYLLGLRRARGRRIVRPRQVGAFALGMTVLWLALVSPIDVYSDELSWMHMVQHMLLMGVAAPLIVLGSPLVVALWAAPHSARRAYGRLRRRIARWRATRYLLWQPLLMWSLFCFTLWVWHLPRLYEATLYDALLHDLQHFTFVAVSCLFWRVLLDPVSRLRLSRGASVIYLFLTSLHATVLGMFMTLAPKAWYPFYESRAPRWNLTALEDQQIAGLIMWMPACAIYAAVAAVVLWLWLREDARAAPF